MFITDKIRRRCISAVTVAAGFLVTLPGNADPVVQGNEIVFQDDGWHEVQTEDTYTTVCEGLERCGVDAGEYIVINHTTGSRYEGLVVTDNSGSQSGPENILVESLGDSSVISWTSSNWYQVQSADDFTTICEGVSNCTVEPGTYIVIDHGTGQRSDVLVEADHGNESGEPQDGDTVIVNGNIISWTSDGWHQVQSADDFSTVCQGGSECAVDDGAYIVIDHETGIRSDINVPTANTGGPVQITEITIAANTILLPDDGYYQVQSASSFETVCEGETSCLVSDGSYIVINHTTGERYENIIVGGSPMTINNDNYQEILKNIVALIDGTPLLETLSEKPAVSESSEFLPIASIDLENLSTYNCSNGGTATHTINVFGFDDQFSQCAIGDRLIDGDFRFDSSLFNTNSVLRGVSSLQIADSVGRTFLLEGLEYIEPREIGYGHENSWTTMRFETNGNSGRTIVTDYSSVLEDQTQPFGVSAPNIILPDGTATTSVILRQKNIQLSSSFQVNAPWSSGQAVSVNANLSYFNTRATLSPFQATPEMNGKVTGPGVLPDGTAAGVDWTYHFRADDVFYWNSVSMQVTAEDGSGFVISRNSEDRTQFNVELNGDSGLISLPWRDFAPLCGKRFNEIDDSACL